MLAITGLVNIMLGKMLEKVLFDNLQLLSSGILFDEMKGFKRDSDCHDKHVKFPKWAATAHRRFCPISVLCMMLMFTVAGLVMALMPLNTLDAAHSFFLFGVAGLWCPMTFPSVNGVGLEEWLGCHWRSHALVGAQARVVLPVRRPESTRPVGDDLLQSRYWAADRPARQVSWSPLVVGLSLRWICRRCWSYSPGRFHGGHTAPFWPWSRPWPGAPSEMKCSYAALCGSNTLRNTPSSQGAPAWPCHQALATWGWPPKKHWSTQPSLPTVRGPKALMLRNWDTAAGVKCLEPQVQSQMID